MKTISLRTRTLAAIAAFAIIFLSVICLSPKVRAQIATQANDVTATLGYLPYFPHGFQYDQYNVAYKIVTDSTSSAPAAVGKVLVWASPGIWKQSSTANSAFVFGQYGVVTQSAPAVGGLATIQIRGEATAYVLTGGTTAVAFGTPLETDANGNFTANASPTYGTVLGQGVTALGTSQPATLETVWIGNY